jgi:WD repeat-containing protein 35
MFIYLSKKIAIPNCTTVTAISWANNQGYIACGGDSSLLKVLKLESNTDSKQTQLSMNQTLEGHNGAITMTVWNRQHEKLTTADENGMIIVWVLYKGMWYEEMINNRGKGKVTGMQWSKNGEKICIVYEDGAVILGSVDGNRIWGKEIKNTRLDHICWDPTSNVLLFATSTGQLQLFDSQGTFIGKVRDCCHPGMDIKIQSMDWYNGSKGFIHKDVPCLAVCYEDGKVQILRNQRDQQPVIFDTNLTNCKIQWNYNGSILAISGVQFVKGSSGEDKETCVVQFWSPYGQYLRSIKIPGKTISSISWEKDGLRLSMAVDSFIYFANIRPDYHWAYFAGTIVYAFQNPESVETNVVFWNIKTGEQRSKSLGNFLFLTAAGSYCMAVHKSSQDPQKALLTIYDGIGVVCETKLIDFIPKFATVNRTHVLVANESIVLHWQFKMLVNVKLSALDSLRKKDNRDDRCFHIDDIQNNESKFTIQDLLLRQPSVDPITSITLTDNALLLGRQSGVIVHLSMPTFEFEANYHFPIVPFDVKVNCNSSRLAVIDKSGILRLHDLNSKTHAGQLLDIERKDVWDFRWANDDSNLLALSEKTRLIVLNGTEAEEPQLCMGCKLFLM